MRLRCRFGIHEWTWSTPVITDWFRLEYDTGIRTPFQKLMQTGTCTHCKLATKREVS